jgi:hypothetical protein
MEIVASRARRLKRNLNQLSNFPLSRQIMLTGLKISE